MTACVFCYCLCLSAAADPAPETPAAAKPVVLLAGTDEYKAAKGTEAAYEGVVENNPGDGAVGKATRFNAFRLKGKDADGKEFVRELYVPGKAFLLASFVGQRVRVTGKFTDTAAEGKVYLELWPAQLEGTAPAAVVAAPALPNGVLARCGWQPDDARRAGQRVLIYHNGREMAQALRLSGDDADAAATEIMGRKLGGSAVDWSKQMIVVVAAGLRGADVDHLAVTRVEVKDRTLTVFYRLSVGPGPGGFGYPAETVLVDRFDGAVHAEEDPAPPPKGSADK
ncbi:MAG TPA: hypothetical protein VMS17_13820 [Gemmataceae bacterium]|nr:hypothetical protein [Gemmataceae bacterium]